MELAFGGAISLQDFERAQALDGRTRRFERWSLGLVAILLLIQLFPLLREPFALMWLLPMIPLLVFVLGYRFLIRWQLRRSWQANRAVYDSIEGRVYDDHVTYNTAHSTSAIRWALFHSARVAPDMVLLYQTPQAFNVFPRDFFRTEADWTAFTRLVAEKVSARR